MRNLSVAALNQIAKQTGTEPICFISVAWTDQTVMQYADKDITGIPGKILHMSELDEIIKLENRGITTNISVTLDDSDGSLLALLGGFDIHRRPCNVYQYFTGMNISDAFLLFAGWIASPITWDEGERTLTFDILGKVLSMEIGFTPEDGQLPNLMPDLVGHPWPLGFGNVVNALGVRSGETRVGFSGTQFGYPDPTLPNKITNLTIRLAQYNDTWNTYYNFIFSAMQIARTPFNIRNDYIDDILAEDELKQQREDMMTQIQELDRQLQGLRELVYEAITVSDQQDILNQLSSLNSERELIAKNLEQVSAQLSDTEVDKKILTIEGANREYAYTVIKTIIDKMNALEQSYWDGMVVLEQMLAALFYQRQLIKSTITVGNGFLFPQGQEVRVIIGGFIFSGTFSGDSFSLGERSARYTNVIVSGFDSTRPDIFNITDPAINLKGMYCLLPTGFIVRVTEQQGVQCQIELVERQKPTGMSPGDTPKPPPADTDLDFVTWGKLAGASEHTDNEKQQIIAQAIGKTTQGEQIQEMQKNIQSMIDLVPEASTESDAKDLQDAIYNNISYYNEMISQLQIPADIEAKAEEQISKEEFDFLLRLQNLEKLEDLRDQTGIGTAPRQYYKKWYVTGKDVTKVLEAAPSILPQWLLKLNYEQYQHLPDTQPWVSNIGAAVVLSDQYQEKYIANILPSTVVAVNAFRSVDGFKQLVPVPTSYYTKNENEAMGVVQDGILFGLNVTSISLKQRLSEYAGQGWEDQIYICYSSSIGPNIVDVIEWLIQTYTTLQIDTASFNTVQAAEINYPVGFVFTQQKEVMQALEEIAWQARIRIVIKANIVYLIYLPVQPTSIATITEDDVLEGSMSLTTTDTENLVTAFRCNYVPDYAYPDRAYYAVLRHNFTKYGRIEKAYDFYIYNNISLVIKSATFWMIRLSNSFKIIKFKCPLTKLNIETGDVILLNFIRPWLANQSILAEVTKAQYNTDDCTIDIECWTPVLLGSMIPYNFFWPAGISEQDYFPTIVDISGGNAGNPIGQYVPTGSAYNFDTSSGQIDPNSLQLRPQSYGDIAPSDSGDSIPPNPLQGMGEVDYLPDLPISGSTNPPAKTMSTEVPSYTKKPPSNETEQKKQAGTTVLSPEPGKGGYGAFAGRVLFPANDPNFNLPLTQAEQQEITELNPGQYSQIYSIQFTNGQTVKARQLRIHTKSKIPFGTVVTVFYDNIQQVYSFQAPTWGSRTTGN